jgi:filamentous hemagglutinin
VNVGSALSFDGKLAPSGTGVGMGKDSGSASSTTSSGISGIAGNKDVRTGDAANGIQKIFDAAKVQNEINAQTQITQMFGQQASKAIGDYATAKMKEAVALKEQAAKETDPERIKALKAQAQTLEDQWGDQGSMRLLAHTVVGGLTGGANGAAGAATSTLAAPEIAKALSAAGVDPNLAKAITATATTALGAAVGGAAGAGAALNEVANNFLGHIAQAERDRLRAKKAAGQTLTPEENRNLAMLEIADQMSNELLTKFRNGVALTKEEQYNLTTYLSWYQRQNGQQAVSDLVRNGSTTNGFPYAGTPEARKAYTQEFVAASGGGIRGNLAFLLQPASQNQSMYNDAMRESGMGGSLFGGELKDAQDYLPSRMSRYDFTTLDSLLNSPILATSTYLASRALGADKQTTDRWTVGANQLSDIAASFVLPKTKLSPMLGVDVAEAGMLSPAAQRVVRIEEKAGMGQIARDYNDSATGAQSNPTSRKGLAPALERTQADGTTAWVKFDGVDGDVLVDRKTAIVTTPKGKEQAIRQSEALAQNGLIGRWEVPNEQQANRATKMLNALGVNNISVKVVPNGR